MNTRPTSEQVRMSSRGAALGLLLGVVLIGYLLLAPRAGRDENRSKDFSHLWLGGRMIVAGRAAELYDPAAQEQVYREADAQGRPPAVWIDTHPRYAVVGAFFYPPPTALAYALLAWLPLPVAAVVNAYFNIGLILLLTWLLARRCGLGVSLPVAGLALLLHPACFVTVALGQNAVLSAALVMAGWAMCRSGQDFRAGLIWGLLILKPNLLVAVGWIPLIHGRFRMLGGMCCSAAAVVGVTLASGGWQPFEEYLTLLRRLSDLPALSDYNLALTYNGLSVFRKWLGVGSAADVLGWLSAAALPAVCWSVTRGHWQPGTVRFRRLLGCCLTASLWINPHLFYYDLLLIVPCLLAAGPEWRTGGVRSAIVLGLIGGVTYAAIPWDDHWPYSSWLPVPSLALLALWCWHIWRTRCTAGFRRILSSIVPRTVYSNV